MFSLISFFDTILPCSRPDNPPLDLVYQLEAKNINKTGNWIWKKMFKIKIICHF